MGDTLSRFSFPYHVAKRRSLLSPASPEARLTSVNPCLTRPPLGRRRVAAHITVGAAAEAERRRAGDGESLLGGHVFLHAAGDDDASCLSPNVWSLLGSDPGVSSVRTGSASVVFTEEQYFSVVCCCRMSRRTYKQGDKTVASRT